MDEARKAPPVQIAKQGARHPRLVVGRSLRLDGPHAVGAR